MPVLAYSQLPILLLVRTVTRVISINFVEMTKRAPPTTAFARPTLSHCRTVSLPLSLSGAFAIIMQFVAYKWALYAFYGPQGCEHCDSIGTVTKLIIFQ